MEWSNELVVEFLQLYEQEPIIWNPKNEGHKDRNAVHDAWKRIETKFSGNYPLKDIKKKKDALMATFRKLQIKVKSSMKTGSGAGDVFKPEWFAYDQMAKFLHSVYNPRKTQSSEDLAYTQNDDVEMQDNETSDAVRAESNMDPESQSSTSENSSNVKCFKAPIRKEIPGNKKRKIEKSNTENRMDEAYSILKVMTEKPEDDECSLFAELLCRKLRALNEDTREIAMYEINNVMHRLKHPQNMSPYVVSSQNNISHAGYLQSGNPPEFQYFPRLGYQQHCNPHSQTSSVLQPPPHRYSQPFLGTQPPSRPPSQPSPGFPLSPYSESQPSPGFSPSPHSNSQPSPACSPSPQPYMHTPAEYPPSANPLSQLYQATFEDILEGERDNNNKS